MLDRLIDYAINHGLTPEPGFAAKTIKWAIVFTESGEYVNVIPLGDEGRGRNFPQAPTLLQPELIAGGKQPRCHFLAETLSTVALYLKEDTPEKDQEKARGKQFFFLEMLRKADPVEPGLAAAAATLADPDTLARLHGELTERKAKPTDLGTIIIGVRLPLEQDSWHGWWRQFRSGLAGKSPTRSSPGVRCLISGETVSPAKTHPKIRGLASVGGLPAGDVLVGFDKDAFQSYGLTQSANAPISEEMAAVYSESLNHLINFGSIRLVDSLAAHWYRDSLPADADDPLADFFDPEPYEQREGAALSRARDTLNAIREGGCPDLAGNRYYTLLLSGAGGRVMVRDWQEGSFEDLLICIDNWFDDLDIVGRDGQKARRPKFLAVAGSLVRELKDLPAPLVQGLWRAALSGTPLPYSALALATHRARTAVITDQPANTARMGLIKAYHRRQEDTAVQANLNPDHPDPAYHCGRLLAVLAHLQRAALGDVGAGVVQRYYTAASQSPALVFGRLIANAKNHLNKLSPPGKTFWFETRIAEVMAALKDDIPQTLTLKRQSLFALGYYQQLAFLRTKATKAEQQGEAEGLTETLPVQTEDETNQ